MSRIGLIEGVIVRNKWFRMEERKLGYKDVPYIEKRLISLGFNFTVKGFPK